MQHESPNRQAAEAALLVTRVRTLEIYIEGQNAEMYENDREFRRALDNRIQDGFDADICYICCGFGPAARRIGRLTNCREIPF